MRESIFISHATPEDNDFTRWLGSKLGEILTAAPRREDLPPLPFRYYI